MLKDQILKREDNTQIVTNKEWISPLGNAIYSGEIWHNDTVINGKTYPVPNGKGVAKINKGNFSGAVYDGNFVMGEMEGIATYTLSNVDVFTGSFHHNQFDEGKYLDKESGEYFEGSFRDMQPYKGKWYSSDGNVINKSASIPVLNGLQQKKSYSKSQFYKDYNQNCVKKKICDFRENKSKIIGYIYYCPSDYNYVIVECDGIILRYKRDSNNMSEYSMYEYYEINGDGEMFFDYPNEVVEFNSSQGIKNGGFVID